MKFICFFLFLIPISLEAKQIELKIRSKLVTPFTTEDFSTKVKATLGHSWKIPLESSSNKFLRMVATQNETSKEILFKAELLEVINGKEKVISRPKMVTVLGKEALMTSGSSIKDETVEVSILPTKIAD